VHRVVQKLVFKTVPGTELELSGLDSYDLHFVFFLWFLFGVWVPYYLLPPPYSSGMRVFRLEKTVCTIGFIGIDGMARIDGTEHRIPALWSFSSFGVSASIVWGNNP